MDKQIQGIDYTINYQVWGDENMPLLLAFHGYGLNSLSWNIFLPLLIQHYRLIALDLPFHGTTVVKMVKGQCFADIVSELIEKEGPGKKYNILAYSLGANYAWHLLEKHSKQVNRVLLLAPDGLKTWDHKRFLRYNPIGKFLSTVFIHLPIFFTTPIKLLKISGLLSAKNADFYLSNISRESNRKRLIQRWANVAELKVKIERAINQALKNEVQINIVFGRFDTIISPKEGKKLNTLIKVEVEDIGHNMLIKKSIRIIKKWIKSNPLPQNNK